METNNNDGYNEESKKIGQILNPNCSPSAVSLLTLMLLKLYLEENPKNADAEVDSVELLNPDVDEKDAIVASIQLGNISKYCDCKSIVGIQQAIENLTSEPDRDLLRGDFYHIQKVYFPKGGSKHTPAHKFPSFTFKNYSPLAFRYFRYMFGIPPCDFLKSLCENTLRELSNPGASGSLFYLTKDDRFVIKTVQKKEGQFLRYFFNDYFMKLVQNRDTLLPQLLALYRYQHYPQKTRLLVMNNLLPSSVVMHQRYDLKGSTFQRKASKAEREKSSPTFKDLDFLQHYPGGIFLESKEHKRVIDQIKRDCRVLESLYIMDYSLLLAIHKLDPEKGIKGLAQDVLRRGVPAWNAQGERLLLFMGIIDILQTYTWFKKFEHFWKSIFQDGEAVSVQDPSSYAQRFQKFMAERVFKTKISNEKSSLMESIDDLDGGPIMNPGNKRKSCKITLKHAYAILIIALILFGIILASWLEINLILLSSVLVIGPVFWSISSKAIRVMDDVVLTPSDLKQWRYETDGGLEFKFKIKNPGL